MAGERSRSATPRARGRAAGGTEKEQPGEQQPVTSTSGQTCSGPELTANPPRFLVGAEGQAQDGFPRCPKAGVTSLPARPCGSHCPGQVSAAGEMQHPQLCCSALIVQFQLQT